MKSMLRIFLTTFVLAGVLAACSLPGSSGSSNAVSTVVAGTQHAQALAQATVNANSLTSMPPTATPGAPVEYVTMTEEELTALINQSVDAAVAATDQTTAAVTSATSDGTVTQDEVTYVYTYYYAAEDQITQLESEMTAYADEYAALANEMITAMNGIQTELDQMNTTLSDISTSLNEISSTLSQGLTVAQDTITQLEATAQQAQDHASNLQSQAQNLSSTLQKDQQERVNQLSQIQPNNIPTDKISAFQSAFQFVDAAKLAMGDNKLSKDELTNLAQLGANAQAGFRQFGRGGAGPDLSQFSGKFSEITTQLARGEMPQARTNVNQFEVSLGQRPSGGNVPGGNLPGGGSPGGGLPGSGGGLPGGGGPRP